MGHNRKARERPSPCQAGKVPPEKTMKTCSLMERELISGLKAFVGASAIFSQAA